MKVGVLALQGAFREHAEALDALGADVALGASRPSSSPVSTRSCCPAASRPRSTSCSTRRGCARRSPTPSRDGLPALAYVRGADRARPRGGRRPTRPAAARRARRHRAAQRLRAPARSFEAPLTVARPGRRPVPGRVHPGAGRRAGRVPRSRCWPSTRAPVLGRQGRVWFATFHPELAGDLRVHERFLLRKVRLDVRSFEMAFDQAQEGRGRREARQALRGLIRQIEVAARSGGGDPTSNATLRTMVQKARDNSLPGRHDPAGDQARHR